MVPLWILSVALFAGATLASNATTLESYPSVVQIEFLQFTDLSTWLQSCSGSVLTASYILTAATCVSGQYYDREFRRIRAGSNYRNTGGIVSYVEIEINYPNFASTASNDISVVRLNTPLVYSNYIRQATIPATGSIIPAGIPLVQTGWGRNNETELTSAAINTVQANQCGESASVYTNLCSSLSQAVNVSNDDFGSPWFYQTITVGVVTGIQPNVTNAILGVAVAPFTSWILSIAV